MITIDNEIIELDFIIAPDRMMDGRVLYEIEQHPYRIEIKNNIPNNTIDNSIKEIEFLQEKVLNIFKKSVPTLEDYICSHEQTSFLFFENYNDLCKGKQTHDKWGSIHINLTLGYNKNEIQDRGVGKFYDKHKLLMKSLQLLEPLFLANFTNVMYNTYNDKWENFENSFRVLFDDYFNFLANINYDNFYDYDTENSDGDRSIDFRDNINGYKDNKLLIDVFDELKAHQISKSKSKTKYKLAERGVDFRWSKKFDKSEEGGEAFGFEFRALDLISNEHLNRILHLIFMLADYIELKNIEIIENPIDILYNYEIVGFIVTILLEGWNTDISPEYLNILNIYLKLELELDNEINCNELLQIVFINLKNFCLKNWDECKYLKEVTDKESLIKIETMPNINKESYKLNYELQMKNNPELDVDIRNEDYEDLMTMYKQ